MKFSFSEFAKADFLFRFSFCCLKMFAFKFTCAKVFYCFFIDIIIICLLLCRGDFKKFRIDITTQTTNSFSSLSKKKMKNFPDTTNL